MKKYKIPFLFLIITLLPIISFAAPLGGVKSLVLSIKDIINSLIPVMFGLALLYFFWGLAQFILHSGEKDAIETGKQKMLWGVIALFVFVSIFGILKYIGDSVGIGPGGLIEGNSINGTGTGSGGCVPDESNMWSC